MDGLVVRAFLAVRFGLFASFFAGFPLSFFFRPVIGVRLISVSSLASQAFWHCDFFTVDIDLLYKCKLFINLTGERGVSSWDELSKRTTNRFEVVLHEGAHLFEAISLSLVIRQVLHFLWVTVQVVQLIFIKEPRVVCPSYSNAQTPDVRQRFW